MKKLIAIAALVSLLVLAGCTQGQTASSASAPADSSSTTETRASEDGANVTDARDTSGSSDKAESRTSFFISIDDVRLTVKPADTEAARALIEQLQAEPVTVNLHAYGGFEQVGPLPWSLPTSDEQITTSPGDIMLYQGNQITIFTGSNSWAYTPLGSIEGASTESLLEVFGGDAIEATLSLE